jgi:hypothetical protein
LKLLERVVFKNDLRGYMIIKIHKQSLSTTPQTKQSQPNSPPQGVGRGGATL